MLGEFAANQSVNTVLRALQLLLAVAILGTDGYAVHAFRSYTTNEDFWFGDFVLHVGVPDAWGFLLFCAGWTIVGVIFLLVAGSWFADHFLMRYTLVTVEAVALLSWLSGFIAVAVNIGSNACPTEENGCGAIIAATVLGGLEWLLFVATALLTFKLVFGASRWPFKSKHKSSTLSPDTHV